ncbi:MAG: DUF2203 domain-containing protein [Gemmatimonadota bacterium]|nr:MAG: DUF2203 domain-containing protein [Gemmatimonadota bacterium]
MVDESIQYFTLEEANKTLPYVRPIVSDIVEAYCKWKDGVRRYEVIAASSRGDSGETDEQVELREEVEQIAREINAYLEELATVGCVFKGFDDGLVDFHSRLEGRDIFLCWKLGEDEITHWHELDAGAAGRQELVPELVQGRSE